MNQLYSNLNFSFNSNGRLVVNEDAFFSNELNDLDLELDAAFLATDDDLDDDF